MSIMLMTEVFRLDLHPTDKLVLLALADAAHDEGHTHIPVRRRRVGDLDKYGRRKLDLLIKTSLSERAVQMAIKRLVAAGHLERTERAGLGVDYVVTPRTICGGASAAPPQETAPTPAGDAGKPLPTVKHKGGCPDDFKPDAKPESKTAQRMAKWSPEFLEIQIEKFIAHHQGKGTTSANWNKQWTTWALNDFDGKAGNAKSTGNRDEPQSAMVRAAVARAGQRRNGHHESPVGRNAVGGQRNAPAVAGPRRPF